MPLNRLPYPDHLYYYQYISLLYCNTAFVVVYGNLGLIVESHLTNWSESRFWLE